MVALGPALMAEEDSISKGGKKTPLGKWLSFSPETNSALHMTPQMHAKLEIQKQKSPPSSALLLFPFLGREAGSPGEGRGY